MNGGEQASEMSLHTGKVKKQGVEKQGKEADRAEPKGLRAGWSGGVVR
ncbi:hypothetical protein ACFSUD_18980 [Sulfitobacter aestuarii]|uniref:Uncharacterized protein n=1 Tax=Sulfitobacter aestuarii TaxID=2161676 RepID=A0ABW5U6Y9_9RHOB